ncbi:tryptophan--tRNA ligase, partial [Roseateles sp. GG27B]
PMRARYAELMAHPERIEAALQIGAAKARALAAPLLAELRQAVGLRNFTAIAAAAAPAPAPAPAAVKAALPVFKQYREADGRFYFKLNAAD